MKQLEAVPYQQAMKCGEITLSVLFVAFAVLANGIEAQGAPLRRLA